MDSLVPEPPPPPPLPSLGLAPIIKLDSNQDPRGTASMITPTTAGLIQYSAANNNTQQVPVSADIAASQDPTNNQLFKDELLAQHSRLSSANDAATIEDRIKLNKANANSNFLNSNSISNGCNYGNTAMPEKLLSTTTLQQDKRPFAYSPDVNDPNNRGKLDLSQIKSPIMKRRLLANMDSTSEEETCGVQDNFEDYSGERIESFGYQNGAAESPTKEIFGFQTSTNSSVIEKPTPRIQYHESPVFYNTHLHKSPLPNYQVTDRTKKSIDELEMELTKSLDSMTLLASNLNSGNKDQYLQQQNSNQVQKQQQQQQQNELFKQTTQPRSSTFSSNGDTSFRYAAPSRSNANRNQDDYYCSNTSSRSIGDYLLSPDSNYFSAASSASPYSISPYYGSPLDVGNCEFSCNYNQPKPISSRTFSPPNPIKPSYYNDDNSGERTKTREEILRNSMEEQCRLLRREAAKIETELNRLQNYNLR